MISTALFIIILVLINAPAWTYILTGVYFAFNLVQYDRSLKAKKTIADAYDKLIKELEDDD